MKLVGVNALEKFHWRLVEGIFTSMYGDLLEEFVQEIVETRKSHHLPSAGRRLRQAGGEVQSRSKALTAREPRGTAKADGSHRGSQFSL